MRRLLAAIAAVLMVAGGFIVWQTRNDSESASLNDPTTGIKTIWCVREAETACLAANIGIVVVMTPAAIEAGVAAAGGIPANLGADAIVAPTYWLQRWKQLVTVTVPVAQSELVAVEKRGSATNCNGLLTCLANRENRFSMPNIRESSGGLLTAGLALKSAKVANPADDADPTTAAVLDAVKKSFLNEDTATMLRNLLTLSLLDSAVVLKADINTLSSDQAVATPVVPNGKVTLAIGTFANRNAVSIGATLTRSLTENGWDAPVAPQNLPNDIYLNDTYKALG